MILLACTIPGQPVGKGRPRVTTAGGFARAYTPPKTAHWEGLAVTIIQQHKGMRYDTTMFRLVVRAVGERPKRLMRRSDPAHRIYRAAKPDGDNVLKAVSDALVRADVMRDDVQIVEWQCSCFYAAKDEGPSVELELHEIDHSSPAEEARSRFFVANTPEELG